MRANSRVYVTPQFAVLSQDQREDIHLATLEALEGVGVFVDEPEALGLLHGAGAHVLDGNRVTIPAPLVAWAVDSAPKRVCLSNRDGERVMFLEDGRLYYGSNADAPDYLDPFTSSRRPCSLRDAAAMALVTDRCQHMDFVLEAGCVTVDVDADASGPAIFRELITHTRKVIGVCHGGTLESTEAVLDMAAALRSGVEGLRQNPFIFYYSEPISPLQHNTDSMRKLLLCAERGVPIVYVPAPVVGVTAPCAFAGTLAQLGAEVLSGLVVHQLKRRGAPFIYGGVPFVMDMKTSVVCYGAPEVMLMSAAMVDMGHYYRLPVFTTAGCGDAKFIDPQFATEAALSCLLATLSGGNLVHDSGLIDAAQMVSPEGVVLADEIVGMIKRIFSGVPVTEETLALDVVAKVGPGGHYLDTGHTLRHFREMWYPQFFDRVRQDVWLTGSQASVGDRINSRTREIIETHRVPSLPDSVLFQIDEIVSRYTKTRSS